MENEKNLYENPAFQELPDESLDVAAGAFIKDHLCYWCSIGDEVEFRLSRDDTTVLVGRVTNYYPREYNGHPMPHYNISVRNDRTYYGIPQDFIGRRVR